MKFPLLHRVSKQQLAILLKTRLLLIAACANVLHAPLEQALRRKYRRQLSLLKFMNYLSKTPANFIRALRFFLLPDNEKNIFLNALARYSCYDKRKRHNFSDVWSSPA